MKMPKQMFEQGVIGDGGLEMPEAMRNELIEEAERSLQILMDRATNKINLAFENKLISEDDEERLYKFLVQINEEIAAADEDSKDINETLIRLKTLSNRLKLPEDIKLEKQEELTLQKLEEWIRAEKEIEMKNAEAESLRHETAGDAGQVSAQKNILQNILHKKRGGGIYGRIKVGKRDSGEIIAPPAV